MKRLVTLFIVLLSVKGYSQTGDNSVCMPVEVARQVAADLITGDSAKAILSLTEKELDLSKEKLNYKDSLILTAKLKELNLNEQLRNEKLQKDGYKSLYDNAVAQYNALSKDYRRYKTKKKFTDILFTAGLLTLGGLFIFK